MGKSRIDLIILNSIYDKSHIAERKVQLAFGLELL